MADKMLIIELKRQKQTFFITTDKPETLKEQLISMITAAGGLGTGEDDDIDIPVPSFSTADDEDDDDDDEETKIEVTKPADGLTIPKVEDIEFGAPIDISDPYNSGFKKIDDWKTLKLVDYSILAFKLIGDEDFIVQEPTDPDDNDEIVQQ